MCSACNDEYKQICTEIDDSGYLNNEHIQTILLYRIWKLLEQGKMGLKI